MSSVPAVSVVLPVHNGGHYLEASVRSILAQSFGNFELLVGDDGSDDGTAQVLHGLAEEEPRIRLLNRAQKSGLAASANWVVSHARAPLVAIAHADDLSHPDRLRRQAALFEAAPDVVLVGAMASGIDASGRTVSPSNLWRLLKPGGFAPFSHSSVMFRRSAFETVGGYRAGADLWEDLDLYWRLSRIGRTLVIPDTLASYRQSYASVRTREKAEWVEHALARMYRAHALGGAGRDYEPVFTEPPPSGRIHPRIFVARSWPSVWNGQRTDLLPRLLKRGALRADLATLQSIAFVAWATLSPRTLRRALRTIVGLRNHVVRRLLGNADFIEWHGGGGRPAPQPGAARPPGKPD